MKLFIKKIKLWQEYPEKIKFTEESVNDLFQECYNETHNIRAQIVSLLTNWKRAIKDSKLEEIATIGREIIQLIGQEDRVLNKKLEILKLLKEIVFDKKKMAEKAENENDVSLTEEEQNRLLAKLQETRDEITPKNE